MRVFPNFVLDLEMHQLVPSPRFGGASFKPSDGVMPPKGSTPLRRFPGRHWKTLEQALVLTPSSFGLQPWKFLVIQNRRTARQAAPARQRSAQVTEASHYIVFTMLKNMRVEHVDRYIARVAEVQAAIARIAARIIALTLSAEFIDGYRSLHVNTWACEPDLHRVWGSSIGFRRAVEDRMLAPWKASTSGLTTKFSGWENAA